MYYEITDEKLISLSTVLDKTVILMKIYFTNHETDNNKNKLKYH